MIETLIALAFVLATCIALGYLARRMWGTPGEGDDVIWASALAPELPPSSRLAAAPVQRHTLAPAPVEVIRVGLMTLEVEHVDRGQDGEPDLVHGGYVEHVGAIEDAPAAGAIGTLADRPSDDLLTYAEQVAGEPDEWAGFTQALVEYENAMLTRRMWIPVHDWTPHESTQQRIDRWLSEGGDGVRAARAETRQAVSETWDAPSSELPLVDRPDVQAAVEAMLLA